MNADLRISEYDKTNSMISLFSGISDKDCQSYCSASSHLALNDTYTISRCVSSSSHLSLTSKDGYKLKLLDGYSTQHMMGTRKIARKPTYPGQRIKMVELKKPLIDGLRRLRSYSIDNCPRKSSHRNANSNRIQSISDSEDQMSAVCPRGGMSDGVAMMKRKQKKRVPSESKVNTPMADCDITALSPWERWVLDKEIERLKAIQITAKKQAANEMKKKALERQQEEKNQLYKIKLKEWTARKLTEQEKTKEMLETARMKQIAAETKREADKYKAEKMYNNWLEEKNRGVKAEKVQEYMKQCQDNIISLTKKNEAQAAFEEWKLKTGNTSKRLPLSYGISDGVVIGYFDRTSVPAPSFCNKQEWIS